MHVGARSLCALCIHTHQKCRNFLVASDSMVEGLQLRNRSAEVHLNVCHKVGKNENNKWKFVMQFRRNTFSYFTGENPVNLKILMTNCGIFTNIPWFLINFKQNNYLIWLRTASVLFILRLIYLKKTYMKILLLLPLTVWHTHIYITEKYIII